MAAHLYNLRTCVVIRCGALKIEDLDRETHEVAGIVGRRACHIAALVHAATDALSSQVEPVKPSSLLIVPLILQARDGSRKG